MTALSLNREKWWIDYTPGVSEQPGTPWRFQLPYGPDNYVTVVRNPCAFNLNDFTDLTMVFAIIGTDAIFAANGLGETSRVRFFIQRSGDLLMEGYEDYRWWSTAYVDLLNGAGFELTTTLDAAVWFNVSGEFGDTRPDQFAAALQSINNIGFSFGAASPDLGVYLLDGSGRFQLDEFTLTDVVPEEDGPEEEA